MIDASKLDTTTLTTELETMHGTSPAYMMRMASEAADRLRTQSAEIERLTDALAAAERERDVVIETLENELTNAIEACEDSGPLGTHIQNEARGEAKAYRHVIDMLKGTPPQPDTADAAGAETVLDMDAVMRSLNAQTFRDAVHQAHYTIEMMQDAAAEEDYTTAFEKLAVVLVNHNIALKALNEKEGAK